MGRRWLGLKGHGIRVGEGVRGIGRREERE